MKVDLKAIRCIHCGETLAGFPAAGFDAAKATEVMKAHDAVCEKHPLMARVRELEADKARRDSVNPEIAPRLAYICGTNLKYEMDAPDMHGKCSITPNVDYAKSHFGCTDECGLAEVEVRFVRWIIEPTI